MISLPHFQHSDPSPNIPLSTSRSEEGDDYGFEGILQRDEGVEGERSARAPQALFLREIHEAILQSCRRQLHRQIHRDQFHPASVSRLLRRNGSILPYRPPRGAPPPRAPKGRRPPLIPINQRCGRCFISCGKFLGCIFLVILEPLRAQQTCANNSVSENHIVEFGIELTLLA